MKSLHELNKLYFNVLRKDLLTLEVRRKKLLSLILLLLLWTAIGLPVFYFIYTRHWVLDLFSVVVVLLTVLPMLVGIYKYSEGYRIYRSLFKEQIIRSLITFIDEKLEYFSQGFIDEWKFSESKLFLTQPDRYGGDDYVNGMIGATRVEFSEVNAAYRTRSSKGSEQWHTIFKGLFFIADFNKNFTSELVIVPDFAEAAFGYVGKMMQSWNTRRGQLMSMEDPEFEKLFAVYGTDQIDARYILTPALMSRITAFRKKCKRNLFISFTGSKIYIAISYPRDLFEPRIFRTLLDYEQIEQYYRDLEMIVGIVDQLNLNTRIWSKQL